ncbi:MAG: hypothetical protein NC397_08230 [Clostridium sp.]|nr:hypothetical protein [Clostridium sp.]
MKLLISIQYPIAVIEVPDRWEKIIFNIKSDLIDWLNDGISESVLNTDWNTGEQDVLSKLIEWLSQYLFDNEKITIVELESSKINPNEFSKKQKIYI